MVRTSASVVTATVLPAARRAMADPWPSASEAGFRASVTALSAFNGRHLENVSCSYVVPEMDGRGDLSQRHPAIVKQLNRDCAKLHVTRYATQWNVGYWLLREAAEGRTYGGEVLELSGRSSIRQYLTKPGTRFVEAFYPVSRLLFLCWKTTGLHSPTHGCSTLLPTLPLLLRISCRVTGRRHPGARPRLQTCVV